MHVQFYTPEELTAIEDGADSVNSKATAGLLPPECFHVTAGRSGSAKRTKFFFGARYLWTREQMSSIATARRAHGVRVDVPAIPSWVQVSHAHSCSATLCSALSLGRKVWTCCISSVIFLKGRQTPNMTCYHSQSCMPIWALSIAVAWCRSVCNLGSV